MLNESTPNREAGSEPDYVAINREGWTQANAQYTSKQAQDAWAQEEITWGKWSIPERELRVLPEVEGKDVVELGCGTGYFGAWLKRACAQRVVRPRLLGVRRVHLVRSREMGPGGCATLARRR